DGRLTVSRPVASSWTLSGMPLRLLAPASWTVPTRWPLTRTSRVAAPGTRSCDRWWTARVSFVVFAGAFRQPVKFSSRRPTAPFALELSLVLLLLLLLLVLLLLEDVVLTVVVIGAATQVIGALTVVVVVVTVIT